MLHKDKITLQKVIREIGVGEELLGNVSLDDFLKNEMQKRAVAMTVINIGELIKNISSELRMEYPEVPWKAVAGMRDLAAHKYQTLRMEDVYLTAKSDFTSLKSKLEFILTEQNI